MLMKGQVLLAAALAGTIACVMCLFARIVIWRIYRRLTGRDRLGHGGLDHRWSQRAILLLGAVGLCCMAWGYLVEPYRLEVTSHTVETQALPAGAALRIVHLSDFHIEEEGPRELRIPELVNREEPDFVVLTGDYLNNGSPEAVAALAKLLAGLKPRLGILAVTGNWDYSRGAGALQILQRAGVQLMDGVSNVIEYEGGRIRLTGLLEDADPSRLVDAGSFHILMYHTPDEIENVAGAANLYLCGHTHGGQVRLPLFGAVVTLSRFWKQYEAGRYEVNGTTLYVNRGIGMEGGIAPRVRFLSRPEIAVFDIVGIRTR